MMKKNWNTISSLTTKIKNKCRDTKDKELAEIKFIWMSYNCKGGNCKMSNRQNYFNNIDMRTKPTFFLVYRGLHVICNKPIYFISAQHVFYNY